MNKKKSIRWSSGVTIIEMVTTIVVLGIITIGLGISLRTVMYHYQDDSVLRDVHHYGNSVMREIKKEISLARFIQKDEVNGFSRLRLTKFDINGIPTNLTVTANEGEGILFDNKNPLNGNLKFPTQGRFRDQNQRKITLNNFQINQANTIRPNLVRFASASWDIYLEIAVETKNSPGGTHKEVIHFHKSVFMPNNYLSLR